MDGEIPLIRQILFHFQKMVSCHELMAIQIRGDITQQGISSCSCACVQDMQLSGDVEGVGEHYQGQNKMWKTEIRAHDFGAVAGLALPAGQCHWSHQSVLFCI